MSEDNEEHTSVSTRFRRFQLLLWKSYLWHRYYWWWTIIEIVIRCFIPFYLGIKAPSDIKLKNNSVTYTTPRSRIELLNTSTSYNYLAYAPSISFTDGLMKNVVEALKLELGQSAEIELVKLSNENDLEEFTLNRSVSLKQPPIGIVFLDLVSDNVVPNKLTYKLRHSVAINTNLLLPEFSIVGEYEYKFEYWYSGFSAIQLLVNEEFTKMKMGNSSWPVPQSTFQEFPYPEYETSEIDRQDLLHFVCSAIVCIEMALCIPFISSVIAEKQSGAKELMKVYGVEESFAWLSWFLVEFVIIFISVTLGTILMKIPFKGYATELSRRVEFSVLWTFLMLFSISNLTLTLFICTIFNSATIAALIYVFINFFSVILIHVTYLLNLRSTSLILCVIPAANILKAVRYLLDAENHGFTFNWSMVKNLRDDESSIKAFVHFVFFLFDIIAYSSLAIYIGSDDEKRIGLHQLFIPGTRGIKKETVGAESFQKVVERKHCEMCNKTTESSLMVFDTSKNEDNDDDDYDGDFGAFTPVNPELTVQIENLHKEGVVDELNGVSMEFYDHEIGVVLGHIGAGKTTILSILCGLLSYNLGSIYYKGIDVHDDSNILKIHMGICFKENRLFRYVSVLNHLIFYGMLKGLSKSNATDEAEHYLMKMEMQGDEKSKINVLSRSTKRKLSIAISFMGDRPLLLLDEPMIGLSPEDKITTWNFLMGMRTDHTIVLTSNFEKEAERLADRITVLENGSVVAHGTPEYLRKRIGINYEIAVAGNEVDFASVTETIQQIVSASVLHQTSAEVIYEVPLSESSKFVNLFENLENDNLGISEINVSSNSIEHVLMRSENLPTDHYLETPYYTSAILRSGDNLQYDSTERSWMKLRQMKILFKKRLLYVMKDYKNVLGRIIIPTLVALLLILILQYLNFDRYVQMEMSLDKYINPSVMISNSSNQRVNQLLTNYLNSKHVTYVTSENSSLIESLIDFGRKDVMRFRRELIVAFEFEVDNPHHILYNLWTLHSLPIAIATYSNIVLRNATNDESLEIITYNHPLPQASINCKTNKLWTRIFLISMVLFVLFGYFTIEIVLYLFELSNKEIASNLMHLQIISGVPIWIYWFTTIVFDSLFFIIVIAIRIMLLKLFDIEFFKFNSNFEVFVSLILLFGVTGLFYAYIISFLYKPKKITYAHLFELNFSCNLLIAMLFTLTPYPGERKETFGRYSLFTYLFMWFPILNFPWAITQYLSQWYIANECLLTCSSRLKSWCEAGNPVSESAQEFTGYENKHGVLLELIFLILNAVISGLIFILMNFGLVDFVHNFFKSQDTPFRNYDEDVKHERTEIYHVKKDSKYDNVPLLVDGLSKNYIKRLKPITAVEDVSFMAAHGTCFGILRGQEAGKTTVFNMMTAQTIPTRGNVSVEGVEMRKNKREYFSMIGYCPETSPLLDKFTGKEMLTLIAALNGSRSDVEKFVSEWIIASGLDDLQNVKCELYTLGNKRLLSTILALIGHPKVIFLDEPTSNIDSTTRRHLYDIIEQIKHAGRTVVLGSPSAIECYVICDRLTILKNGAMHCLGHPHDLRKHYDLGHFVAIKVQSDVMSMREVVYLEENMVDAFGSKPTHLIEHYRGFLHYQITDPSLKLSVLFGKMEKIKRKNPIIEEYTARTTTLEDIFEYFSHSKTLKQIFYAFQNRYNRQYLTMEEVRHSPTSTHFQRFKLLLWKSYLWHKYYWWYTIIEIVARCLVPVYLGIGVSSDIKFALHLPTHSTIHTREELMDTLEPLTYLAYSPSNEFTKKLMNNVVERLNTMKMSVIPVEDPIGLSNEQKVEEYIVNRSVVMNEVPMGVNFNIVKHGNDNEKEPNKLIYEIRQSVATSTRWLIEEESEPGPIKKGSDYWVGGFAALQLVINEEFIKMKSGTPPEYFDTEEMTFQSFPYPEYESSIIRRDNLLSVVVVTFIAAEVALSVPFIASIIIEKQTGVKNLMRIHHMEESLIWLSWFMKAFVVILASVTLTTIVLKIPFKGHASETVRQTNFSVLWALLLLFNMADVCLVLFLSALFNKATIASLVHMFVHLFSLALLFALLSLNLRNTSYFFWPSPSLCILKGIRLIITAEISGVPYTWSSVRNLHANESNMVLLLYFYFFVFEMAFYFLLTIIFGFFHPGEFGSPKSLLDFFSFLIFGGKHKQKDESNQVYVSELSSRSDKLSAQIYGSLRTEIREPPSPFQEPSLRIEGLLKEFDDVHALERINLEFYENEICVLLGPKNAGKTTLFSILAGSVTFDEGDIFYNGLVVSDELDLFKNDLGICFKEDRLFHFMTVEEHFIFFGKLKGLSESNAIEEAEKYMLKLEIYDERNFTPKKLSKLIKRKLCIGICLIGDRRVLILDEPLDGLDYRSKVDIWNLLSDMRTDRTIIISTSNANEAESLADRIAIMESGFVLAHGTPTYLRNNIGIHYELLVSTNKENFNQVNEVVMAIVHATIERQMDNEIVYRIPSAELPKFSNLFENLERNSTQFEISHIGLTCDTIEHVLMRTGSLSGDFSVISESIPEILGNEYDSEFSDSIGGFHLRFHQLRILLWKKILYMLKDYASILKRIILPSIFAILITRFIEHIDFKPYLVGKISPSIYILQDHLLGTIFPQIILHSNNKTSIFYDWYSNYITAHGATVVDSNSAVTYPEESLLHYAKVDILRYRRELLALFEIQDRTFKIMYNSWAIHSLPIAISVYSNVKLRDNVRDDSVEIITRNHPAPSPDKGCDSIELFIKAVIVLSMLYFTFAFLTTDVVLYLFEVSNKEVIDGLMYLQIMSGVPVWMYWFATFVFDLLFFVVVVAFRIALFVYLDNYYGFFKFTLNFGYFILILLLFGISALFYVYIFSFFYKPTKGAYYAHAFVFNFACYVVVAVCYSFNLGAYFAVKLYGVNTLFSFIFLLIPFLNFPWTVLQYMSQWYNNNRCFIVCSPSLKKWCLGNTQPKPYLEVSSADNTYGILLEVIFLIITFIFGLVLLFLMNSGWMDFLHNSLEDKNNQEYPIFNEELNHEREAIQEIKADESKYHQVSLLVDGLGKNFMKMFTPTVAVQDVSFIAESGTSFGILGEYGSGKTTTMHMMTAKIVPTRGDVSVDGVQPSIDKMQYYSLIGYCPQTSPLLDKFTGRQMLELIISLRGIKNVELIVNEWISFAGLEELQHVKCDLYSNSNKRLLSTALSMVGNPRVVFLDEPANDVDSLSRRHLYDIIELAKHSGKTIVLGSSSSTECDLLCDRLTILINGVMHCIGDTHDLKKTHRLGYFLMIRVHPDITSFRDVIDRLKKRILAEFGSQYCRLLEEYRSLLHYQILDNYLPLSVLFATMENVKSQNPVIEEYVVTTATIQHILDALTQSADFL